MNKEKLDLNLRVLMKIHEIIGVGINIPNADIDVLSVSTKTTDELNHISVVYKLKIMNKSGFEMVKDIEIELSNTQTGNFQVISDMSIIQESLIEEFEQRLKRQPKAISNKNLLYITLLNSGIENLEITYDYDSDTLKILELYNVEVEKDSTNKNKYFVKVFLSDNFYVENFIIITNKFINYQKENTDFYNNLKSSVFEGLSYIDSSYSKYVEKAFVTNDYTKINLSGNDKNLSYIISENDEKDMLNLIINPEDDSMNIDILSNSL